MCHGGALGAGATEGKACQRGSCPWSQRSRGQVPAGGPPHPHPRRGPARLAALGKHEPQPETEAQGWGAGQTELGTGRLWSNAHLGQPPARGLSPEQRRHDLARGGLSHRHSLHPTRCQYPAGEAQTRTPGGPVPGCSPQNLKCPLGSGHPHPGPCPGRSAACRLWVPLRIPAAAPSGVQEAASRPLLSACSPSGTRVLPKSSVDRWSMPPAPPHTHTGVSAGQEAGWEHKTPRHHMPPPIPDPQAFPFEKVPQTSKYLSQQGGPLAPGHLRLPKKDKQREAWR